MIDFQDPEEMSTMTASTVYPESQLVREAVELVGVEEQQLLDHEKELLLKKKQQEKETNEYLRAESKFIDNKENQTQKTLKERKGFLNNLILEKQRRSKEDYEMKKDVLTNSFKASVDSLIARVKKQKDLITSSYGPIILNSKKNEKPVFDINKDLDPVGHYKLRHLNKMQDKLPQSIIVKLKTVRSMKDKVSSGHFLLIVHALDRIGGNRMCEDPNYTDQKFKETSKLLREFAIKKRIFLNQDNRQVAKKSEATGKTTFVKANQTGLDFFKPDAENEEAADPV